MSLAKGDSSSHRKGEEDATDDPPTKTLCGEAPYSKSNRFEEEEGGCDLGSECHPLIDPWYDTHIHFPVVPSDYLPPSSGRAWLSIFCYDSEVCWAPLASFILDLDIHQGTSLPVPIFFEFRSGMSLGLKEWVDMELSDVDFMAALQQAGVLKAIVSFWCLSNY